jgi:deferrochelatase/peroxidase EfeB
MTFDRRTFLKRGGALGLAGLVGAEAGALAAGGDRAGADAPAESAATADRRTLAHRVPFDGAHQAGVLTPAPAAGAYVALDAIAPDRAGLAAALQTLSARARELSQGTSFTVREVDDPPPDSGTLGTHVAPDGLTVTIGFGSSLFDDRYGLAPGLPRRLRPLGPFPGDRPDPARSHGDVLLQVCAQHRDTVVHAVRELLRPVRGALALRWMADGFQSADRGPRADSSRRNLFGFRDGTGNPDPTDAALMDRLVWVPEGGNEPAWASGGTYVVVRLIRMHVEFWDRVGLREQENMIGRRRDTGAPLGGTREFQDPRYDLDPKGDRIPLDAHIRRANPRDAATADQRILRRAYNYDRGFDAAGQLDQGLIFVAFNQDPVRQFETIQRRLDGEPMVDYITPVGGGLFFAPSGAADPTDWVGSRLLT